MVSAKLSSSPRFPLRYLLHPSWLAGLISAGAHGILFAAGPTFSSLGFDALVQPGLSTKNRNVPLIELSAAEQARLPDFSQPFYNFETFDLAPLSPLLEGNSLSGNRPKPTPTLPKAAPSPLTNSRPPLSSGNRLPFSITQLEPPRSGGTSRLPNPKNPAEQTEGPDLSSEVSPEGAATPSGDTTIIPATPPGAAELQRQPQDPVTANPDSTEIARAADPGEVLPLEERLQVYSYDATATTLEESETLTGAWLSQGKTLAEQLTISLNSPDSALNPLIELPVEHSQGICLTKEPQKGLIGAWVGPEGNLLAEPTLLRSTGYSGLNQRALQRVKTLDFSAVTAFTGYQFEIVVLHNSENCSPLGQQLSPGTPAAVPDASVLEPPATTAEENGAPASGETSDINAPTETKPAAEK